MTASRNPERTRKSLLAAGASVLRRHYLDTSGGQSVIPVSVTDIVTETTVLDSPEFSGVSTGAVKTSFGTKDDLLRATACSFGREWFDKRFLPKSLGSDTGSMRRFFEAQCADVAAHVAENRHWLQLCAHAGDPVVGGVLEDIRSNGVENLAIICELAGGREERLPKLGEWSGVAEVLLSWIEGLGVSLSRLPGPPSVAYRDRMVDAGLLLWSGLTEPDPGEASGDDGGIGSPLSFVSAFDFDEIGHWLDEQSLAVRKASARLRKTKLNVPQFTGLGYKPEVTVTVLINSVDPAAEAASAVVGLSLISESGSHTKRGREVKVTIVSGDGQERSALIDGWGRRPTAEVLDVPVTVNSPRDLRVRWEVAEQAG